MITMLKKEKTRETKVSLEYAALHDLMLGCVLIHGLKKEACWRFISILRLSNATASILFPTIFQLHEYTFKAR